MASEVEERIHKALEPHALERIEHGYRVVHANGVGISTLRLLPAQGTREGSPLVAVAEIASEYHAANLPSLHAQGVQRLNSWAVHGAYDYRNGRLRQTAQYSIYSNDSAVHLAAQSILNAFGGQLPLGRSTVLGVISPEALERQRAHHGMPPQWQKPVDPESLNAAAGMLRQRGLAAANSPSAVWTELPLSGDCPSRSIDPQAETALLQVALGVPHPIAGAGYLATISLPLTRPPVNSAQICARLNLLEMQQADFVPRLGAWGLHAPDDLPGYSCFIPASEPLGGMHMTLLWWCISRAAWLRDRFWTAKAGLQLDAIREHN